MRTYRTVAVLAVAAAMAGTSSTAAFAAHESNNRAELTGVGTGVAIVNYAKGAPAEWRSSVNVRGLPDGTHTFRVAGGPMPAPQTLCTFTVGDGRSGCSSDADLRGFTTAQIVDSSGTVVASGVFARRGGQRVG